MVNTRSSSEVWLIGKPTKTLSTYQLPSREEALWMHLFHHLVEKKEVKKSNQSTVEAILTIWERSRVPTQRVDNAEKTQETL